MDNLEKEFEAWLDETYPELGGFPYHSDVLLRLAKIEGARAAWAKAQDEIGRIKSVHVEQMKGTLLDKQYAEEQADKLAEALETIERFSRSRGYPTGQEWDILIQKTVKPHIKEYRSSGASGSDECRRGEK